METLSTAWTTARTELRARRQRREELRRLEHDLSRYSSRAERAELDAIVSRAPVEDAVLLQRIISSQRAA